MHHDDLSLAQGSAQVDVARLVDPARDVALARMVARGRQAEPLPELLRERELGGIIDSGSISQCHDSAEPGHKHQSTTDQLLLEEDVDRPINARDIAPQHGPEIDA